MVTTRRQDYGSPKYTSVVDEADSEETNEEEFLLPHVAVDSHVTWRVSTFTIMDDHGSGSMVRERYSGRSDGVAFNDWKTRFKSWQRTQRQRNPLFNDWWAFEQLPNHLEFEALQSYDAWFEDHRDALDGVEDYWTRRVELVTALKEGAAVPLARAVDEDEEDDDDEEFSTAADAARAARLLSQAARARKTARAAESATSGTSVSFISRLSRASNEAIATIGPPPHFDPLKLFFEHLEVEFGGIRRDRMRHIQDFKKEVGDTPRIMYARLARFARESGDAFTERQLVSLYMSKQDKKLQDMAHPHMLLLYGGRATLAQAFAVVEQLDRGLCVEEAGRLPTTMTTATSQSKTTVAGPSKGQGQGKSSKQVAMAAEVEGATNPNMRCWGCGESGHGKKNCPHKSSSEGKNSGQSTTGGGKGGAAGKGQQTKAQDQGKAGNSPPKCTHAACGRIGHTEAQCWIKNPHLRPQSFVPQVTQGGGSTSGGSSLEARMGELQNTLALLVAASAKSTPNVSEPRPSYMSSSQQGQDRFEYGAVGEMTAAVATRAQMKTPSSVPMVGGDSVAPKEPIVRHKGPADSIGQSRLPLSFGLADVAPRQFDLQINKEAETSMQEDMVKGLALKLLEIPLFSGVQLQRTDFDVAAVYHMAGKMMQGKVHMPANVAMKEVEKSLVVDDEQSMQIAAAKEAADALRHWKGWKKDPPLPVEFDSGPQLDVNDHGSVGAMEIASSYLANVPARAARERLQVKPGVIKLANIGHVFSVATSDSSVVFPQKVLLDTGAQPIMLGKNLAERLKIKAEDLDPCPFTIATSLGGTEQPTGLTKVPLRLRFKVGIDSYTHISIRCVITGATTYDILLGQQALYPIGFGHDCWTEEAWFRPGWSQGDGRKEILPVIFSACGGIMEGQAAMYGCVAEYFALGDLLLEGNMSSSDSPPSSDDKVPRKLDRFMLHPKDPTSTWTSPKDLFDQCNEVVKKVDQHLWEPSNAQPPLQRIVDLHNEPGGIRVVELFAGLGTGLAAALEAGLSIQSYTYVDNNAIVSRAAKHHLQQLQMRYPKQLPASAIQGCMSRLPADIALIGQEDLQRLGRVDLVVAGWPCQGHSRAGLGLGLQDPRSALFWELLRLLKWWQRTQVTPVAYILENVPPLGSVSAQVQADAQEVCLHLGEPVTVDAAALGSYAHRLRWKWTNLAAAPGISMALRLITRPVGRCVDHILDAGRHSQTVVQADTAPLALVNNVGQPRLALPTLMSHPQSFAYRDGGPGMVFDTSTQRLDEPCADERERAMGFPTGTTCAPTLTESQRRQILGQAMDLNSMVWFLGICLAAQRHRNGGLDGRLGAESSSQGAEGGTIFHEMSEVVHQDAKVWQESKQSWVGNTFEWLVQDELRGQRVLAALAQELGKENAKEVFKKVFFVKKTPAFGHVHDQKIASIALEKGNGASSSN